MDKQNGNMGIPARTLERLVVYKRLLQRLEAQGTLNVYSHDLADLANNTPAQVRRDLMIIGHTGSPAKGYSVHDLIARITAVFGNRNEQNVALAGVGNLGRAILAYLHDQQAGPKVVAAFDSDPDKIGRVFGGCPCHDIRDITRIVPENRITLGIITVPAAAAQHVADLMLISGVKGILNLAPVPLKLPTGVCATDVDIMTKLDTLAFFCG